jgi:hypothetical protein
MSHEYLPQGLNSLGTTKPHSFGVLKKYEDTYFPEQLHANQGTMFFNIPPVSTVFTDLNFEIEMEVYFEQSDKQSPLGVTAPVALLTTNMWRSVSVYFTASNVPVEGMNCDYAMKNYLATCLKYGAEGRENIDRATCFYIDTPGFYDTMSVDGDHLDNKGFVARWYDFFTFFIN